MEEVVMLLSVFLVTLAVGGIRSLMNQVTEWFELEGTFEDH